MADRGVTISFDGSDAQRMLTRMMLDRVVEKKDVRKVVRTELRPVRTSAVKSARGVMKSDPRRARLAVKAVSYRRGIGGNVSLLNRRKAGASKPFERKRGGASGITRNRTRSQRTVKMDSYYGRDRAFVLRFLNGGTVERKTKQGANRGRISARNFFGSAESGMREAASRISVRIEKLIAEAAEE